MGPGVCRQRTLRVPGIYLYVTSDTAWTFHQNKKFKIKTPLDIKVRLSNYWATPQYQELRLIEYRSS